MDLAALNRPVATRPLLLSSVLSAFLVVLAKQIGTILVPDSIISHDVKIHIYWMRRFQDPELFRGDLLTEFASSPFFAKKGVTSLYYLASYLIDPVTFCAVLPLILVPVTAYYLFRLGRLTKDNVTATSLVLLYLVMIWPRDMAGFPRHFALPLLVSFLYYLILQRYIIVLLLLALQAHFYPPVFLLSVGVFAFCAAALESKRLRVDRRKAFYLAVSLLLAFVVLAPDYLWYRNERLGPSVTRAETLQIPTFREGSLLDYLMDAFRPGLHPRYKLFMWLLHGTALAVVLTLRKGRRWHLPKEILALPISAMAMFLVAHLFWPVFYVPMRYVLLALPLFAMIVIAAYFLTAASVWAELVLRRDVVPTKSPIPGLLLFTVILVLLGIVWKNPRVLRCPNPVLYEFLKTLPKDILVAGHPADMEWVPTCARRKVLVSQKLRGQQYMKLYQEVERRTFDFFSAYYANSPETIRRFTEKYGIDYLVVDETDFPREGRLMLKPLREPFRDHVRALIDQNLPGGFAILTYPYSQVVWRSNNKFVIEVLRGKSALQESSGEATAGSRLSRIIGTQGREPSISPRRHTSVTMIFSSVRYALPVVFVNVGRLLALDGAQPESAVGRFET